MTSVREAPASATTDPADAPGFRTPRTLAAERAASRARRHQERAREAAATTRRLAAARAQWAEESDAITAFAAAPELTDAQREAAHNDFKARLRAAQDPDAVAAAMARLRAADAHLSPDQPQPADTTSTPHGAAPRKPKNSVGPQDPKTGADLGEHDDETAAGNPDLGHRYEQRNNRLQKRARQLDEARLITRLYSVCRCGAMPLEGAVSVTQKADLDGGFAGLFRCGSVWGCPECSPIVRTDRAAILERQAAAWMTEHDADRCGGPAGEKHDGHGMAMATLTSRHGEYARLGSTIKLDPKTGEVVRDDKGKPVKIPGQIDRTAGAWRRMLTSTWWRNLKARYGLVGATRALEMTHSYANSWHTHIHAVLWFEDHVDAATAREVEAELYKRWKAECKHAKLGTPTRKNGVKVDPVRRGKEGAADAARYLVKVQDKDDEKAPAKALGNELLRGDNKAGHRAGRTPFEILRKALAETATEREQLRKALARGDLEAADALRAQIDANPEMQLWHEYETATKGHRMLTWTGEIKDRLAQLVPDAEERDGAEVVAEEDAKNTTAVLVQVTPDPWRKKVAAVPGRRGQLRVAVKVAGTAATATGSDPETAARDAVRELLESWGLTYGADFYGPGVAHFDPETGEAFGDCERVVPAPRREPRHHRWATLADLDASQRLLGVTPRDNVRPERARRRAAGLPVSP